jgi:chromosome segregation ATPase
VKKTPTKNNPDATHILPKLDMNLAAIREGMIETTMLDLNLTASAEDVRSTPKLDLNLSASAERNHELSLALARIAQLEETLKDLRVTHSSLSHRFLKLQRVHVRVQKDNAQLQSAQGTNSMSFPESISEIIALRKQVSDLTLQLRESKNETKLWQARHESQQHTLDDHARCIDELQSALRNTTANLTRYRPGKTGA